MAIELDDGTIVRSLPEQVDYLTTANENNEIAIDNLTARLEAAIAGVLHYKGSVPTYADLPADAEIGDVYNVIDTGANYAWTGSEWDELGMTVDLSNYVTLDGAQNVTGRKTFIGTGSVDPIELKHDGVLFGGGIRYSTEGVRIRSYLVNYIFGNTATAFYNNANGSYDLGTSSYKWKDLYLSGALNLDGSKIEYDSGDSLFRSYSTFSPSIDNAYDLGDSMAKWRNIYLSGSLRDGNNASYGYTLPDSTSLTANSELVDTASAQTITGVKTFSKINFKDDGTKNIENLSGADLKLQAPYILFYGNAIRPEQIGAALGQNNRRWTKVFCNNLNDGTNDISTTDLYNLIQYAKAQGWIS